METLTLETLLNEAEVFSSNESIYPEPSLYGVTDGKAIGTYVERKFKAHLANNYIFPPGNSAIGIDIPGLDIDIKVTSIKQPQSSSPFKSARQKIFGLGYSLLVFVYKKTDNPNTLSATLDILHNIFIEKERTADYSITKELIRRLENDANEDDLVAYMEDVRLPLDEIEARSIANELINGIHFTQGYLTISNALQWRLQYSRAITQAGFVDGIIRLR